MYLSALHQPQISVLNFFFFFFFFLTALLAFYSVTIVINEKLHVHNCEGKKKK